MNQHILDNRRILVVDDDEIFAVMVDDFLTRKNVFVDHVSDLTQARQLLSHTSFDLILLDNYLPDGLGIELMTFLLDQNIEITVLMITADDDQESMQKCFISGVDDYILKPINLELLWLKMQRCFNAYVVEKQLHLQNQQLETMLDEKEQQEKLARHVYRHLADSANQTNSAIRSYLQASDAFNGDFFISGQSPNGNCIMMLIDATGHGLAAAISVLPVVSALRAMLNKGFSLAHLLHEINSKIYTEIPDDRFVACIGIEVDFQRQQVHFFNGGMPDILLIDDQCQIKHKAKSACLPLGILDSKEFSPSIHSVPLLQGQHLLFYSDGLTEQISPRSEPFSKSEFFNALSSCKNAGLAVDVILAAFKQHSSNSDLQDDVSLCYVDLGQLSLSCAKQDQSNIEQLQNGQLDMAITVSGSLLAQTNLAGLLDDVLKNANFNTPLRQKSFTIFSELINNGLDHGILELCSKLKNDFEGFAEYLEEREERLSQLAAKDKLILKLHYQQADSKLHFSVEDSGIGYEALPSTDDEQLLLSGRGFKLIEKLSESVVVHQPGNITSVIIK